MHGLSSNSKSEFERADELKEVLNHYNISMKNNTIVLMPPTKCSSCKHGVQKILDTLQNIYVLTEDSAHLVTHNSTQKIIVYDENLIQKKGLVKLYPILVTYKEDEITSFKALTN